MLQQPTQALHTAGQPAVRATAPETITDFLFAANKNKGNARVALASSNSLLWNSGFTLMRNSIFFFFKIRQLISYLATLDELRARCLAGRRRPFFLAPNKNISYFLLFRIWHGFGIGNPFSWIFNAISSEKGRLISVRTFPVNLHWRQGSKMFPACWILIGQLKFQAGQLYAKALSDF